MSYWSFLGVFLSHPDVDDDSSHQDADTLHQVSQHVDESGPDAGVAVAVLVAPRLLGPLLMPTAVGVSVWRPRLVEDGRHPAEDEKVVASNHRRRDTATIVRLAHSQDVDDHGAAGREQHDVTVDIVVSSCEPLHGWDKECCRHGPDGGHRQEHTQNLCVIHNTPTSGNTTRTLISAQPSNPNRTTAIRKDLKSGRLRATWKILHLVINLLQHQLTSFPARG